ncbi:MULTISPECIES: nuclear transport factor 2 family protein [Haloferax]|uniref:DUF4440 domain-containing protein n=2 Tax=Haloferax TaxID=2251 RepID=A0A6G1Z497_9EURY|nr:MULTISPECIES: nuclear transport factor 2 family protein [Haloferax]KAB1188620.1 nuclear transport factor 2 family protein [Haloferax sp. CBA1149]MRW81323.1 DUF4440 domain-containing protein [Haloferax marinisediminis]
MAAISKRANVEILEDAYEAYNEGDLETVVSTFADDIEWVEPEGGLGGGTHRGPDAVLNDIFMPTLDAMDEVAAKPERFIDGGDTVVVVGKLTGTAKGTGTRLAVPFAHIIDMKDGKISKCVNNTDTALFQQLFEA